MNFPREAVVGAVGFLEIETRGEGREVGLRRHPATGAVEGALGLQIDRARGRVGVDVGADRLRHLDGLHAGERNLFEGKRAGVAGRALVGVGTAEGNAVQRDLRVFGIEAAEANGADLALGQIEFNARHVFEEFADVALGDIAEHVRSDGVGNVHGIALVHDRLRVALTLGGDGERGELSRPRGAARGRLQGADQLEITRDRALGRNLDRGRDRAKARVSDDQCHRPRRDGRKAVGAAVFRRGDLAGRIDADLGVAEVFAAGGTENASGDGALVGRADGAERCDQRAESKNQRQHA